MTRSNPQIRKQAESLRKAIDHHNYQYYVLDQPEIPDAEYDRLFRQLQQIENEYPELISDDSPTQRVGAQPLAAFATVQHRLPMLSLNNVFSDEELQAFYKRIRERLDTDDDIEEVSAFEAERRAAIDRRHCEPTEALTQLGERLG